MAEQQRRRRRRKRLPEELVTVDIETLSNEGRGISHVGDRVVFIDLAVGRPNGSFAEDVGELGVARSRQTLTELIGHNDGIETVVFNHVGQLAVHRLARCFSTAFSTARSSPPC